MKSNMLALIVIFSLLGCPANMMAKERRGAELVIQKLDGQQLNGELIAVKQSSLLLLNSEGADISVDTRNVAAIHIVKKSKFVQGAGLGLAIGGGAGAVLGVLAYDIIYIDLDKAGYAAFFGALGAALGVAIGGTVGASKGKDETIQIEGKSEAEIKEILEKLRRQARVPNAQ